MISDLSKVETATFDAFLVEVFMAPSIQALVLGVRMQGPALTVRLPGRNGTALRGRRLATICSTLSYVVVT